MLETLIIRLGNSKRLDQLLVVTSDSYIDRAIVCLCEDMGIEAMTGSEDDVLARMAIGAQSVNSEIVVRICGDNPAMDGTFVDRIIERQAEIGGYVGAVPGYSKHLPTGLAAEAFPVRALLTAHIEDKSPEGREHVTPYIRHGRAGVNAEYLDFTDISDCSDLRLGFDSANDYLFHRTLFHHFGDRQFSWLEALDAVRSHEEWQTINADTVQKDDLADKKSDRLTEKNAFDGNLIKGGVKAFNITTTRDAHLCNRAAVVSHFLDPVTGKLKPELTRHRNCPLCGKDAPSRLFNKEGFQHQRCTDCGMIYVTPSLAEEKLHSHCINETSWFKVLTNETQLDMDKRKFRFGLKTLEAYCPDKGKLIDIGCGPGVFLCEAKQQGWNVHGVEFNNYCVSLLREQGISVNTVSLQQSGLPDNSFQAASAWDVLEHVLDPLGFIHEVTRLLASSGVFLVAVPNTDSLVARILHDHSATFAGEAHVNGFTPATMTRLLESNGLEVIHAETYLTELGTINNHLNFENAYAGSGAPVLDCLTPEFLHNNMLGSRLLMLARKKDAHS